MKRKITRVLAIVLALTTLLATGAMAADDNAIRVRVNGEIVAFPDQEPIIDTNGRTLVPVRFATEALGAKVTWNDKTCTATISKNGISVDVAIGRKDITVTKNGNKSTVTMDTEAVLINNRTMVPIRFVAEALGAYVDWSDQYRVVGIYQGELSAEQIRALMAEPVTQDSMNLEFGELPSGSLADLREQIYSKTLHSRYYHALNKDIDPKTDGEQIKHIMEEAKATMEYHSGNLDITFATNPSLVMATKKGTDIYASVRGCVTVNIKNADALSGNEPWYIATLLGMKYGGPGTQTFAVDAHMLITATGVECHEVEGLASAQANGYTWELGHGQLK